MEKQAIGACITLRDPDYLGYVYGIHASQSHGDGACTTGLEARQAVRCTCGDGVMFTTAYCRKSQAFSIPTTSQVLF